MHWIITLCFILTTINLSVCVFRIDQTKQKIVPYHIRMPTKEYIRSKIQKSVKMEIREKNNVEDNVKVESEIKPNERLAEKEKLVRELTDMGFAKQLVLQILENADNVPKDLIVEQLLTSSHRTVDPIPVVDDDGDQLWVDVSEAYKMVVVINMGLKMGIGKIAAQASHATLGLYEVIKNRKRLRTPFSTWKKQGCRKIVVQVKNTAQLVKVYKAGKMNRIPGYGVQDAGLTEVAPSSFTAVAFFGSDDQLEPVTGKLTLLK